MAKRAREDGDATAQQTKKPRRDDAANEKMTNKARYGTKGHYCPEIFPILERAKELNHGVVPETKSLLTSRFPHDTEWTQDNLPEILFFIKPRRVKTDAQRGMKKRNDNVEIKKSDVVPDYVSVATPEWLIGTWLRLDPALSLSDILQRMCADENYIGGKIEKPKHSALNNRLFRKCAKIFGHWTGSTAKNQQQIRATLTDRNVELNTILDEVLVLGEPRLAKKVLEIKAKGTLSVHLVNVKVTADNYLETTFPIDHFKIEADDEPTPALTDGTTPSSTTSEEAPGTPSAVPAPVPAPVNLTDASFPPLPVLNDVPLSPVHEDTAAFLERVNKVIEDTQALIDPSVLPVQAVGPSASPPPPPQAPLDEDLAAVPLLHLDWDDPLLALPALPVLPAVPAEPAQVTDNTNEFDSFLNFDDDDNDNNDGFGLPSSVSPLGPLPPTVPSSSSAANEDPFLFAGYDLLGFDPDADSILSAI